MFGSHCMKRSIGITIERKWSRGFLNENGQLIQRKLKEREGGWCLGVFRQKGSVRTHRKLTGQHGSI